MKYRKKPVVIDAFCLGRDEVPTWASERRNSDLTFVFGNNPQIIISTQDGEMKANSGDYIIKDINDDIYPCHADIFEAIYEAVNE